MFKAFKDFGEWNDSNLGQTLVLARIKPSCAGKLRFILGLRQSQTIASWGENPAGFDDSYLTVRDETERSVTLIACVGGRNHPELGEIRVPKRYIEEIAVISKRPGDYDEVIESYEVGDGGERA